MSNEEAFVNELIGYIFAYPNDDYMTMECLCRKLYKHGLIDKKDGEWTCQFIEKVDTPQTEEPPCIGKPCWICNERNYCKFARQTDSTQTEEEILREQCRDFMGIVEQTERSRR